MATAAAQAAVIRQAAASQTAERLGDARSRTSAASATYSDSTGGVQQDQRRE